MFSRLRLQMRAVSSGATPNPTATPTINTPYRRSDTGPLHLDLRFTGASSDWFSDGDSSINLLAGSTGAYANLPVSGNWIMRPGLRYEFGQIGSATPPNDRVMSVPNENYSLLYHSLSACMGFSYLTDGTRSDSVFFEACGSLISASGSYRGYPTEGLGYGAALNVFSPNQAFRVLQLNLLGMRLAYEQPSQGIPAFVSIALQAGFGVNPITPSRPALELRNTRNAQECSNPIAQAEVQSYNRQIQNLSRRNQELRSSLQASSPLLVAPIARSTITEIDNSIISEGRECAIREANLRSLEEEFTALERLQTEINRLRTNH